MIDGNAPLWHVRSSRGSAAQAPTLALTNHVLFVLPIATTLFGEDAVTPIVAIISMDGILIFSGTIILMDVLTSKGTSFGFTVGKIIRNPPLIAMVLGLIFGVLNLTIPKGIDVFLANLAGTASPVLLFAIGVILSQPRDGENLSGGKSCKCNMGE